MFTHQKILLTLGVVVAASVIAVTVAMLQTNGTPPPVTSDWRADWAVQEGFDITVDAKGFELPTAIAFVPNPGDSPSDPLYFVTELHGKIKVVTNDRSVFTFAENFFHIQPKQIFPAIGQEIGMAGICLAPDPGYLFVTFSYHDSDNVLRNNVVRFQSNPQIFSLAPTSQIEFTKVFAPYQSRPSHQISACQVNDNLLYVNVADAAQVAQSQRLDSLLGKVLRMTLDGRPVPDNPFYQDDDIGNPRNYVWAAGLRNPFGLETVGHQVFVADNGPVIDRFLQVEAGGNYLWDGTNDSIGTNADAVFWPGRGVAQLDHYPPGAAFFPIRFRKSFFMVMTSNPKQHRPGFPAIWAIPYDLSQNRLPAPPQPLMRYRGGQVQVASGLAFGPDGLYFVPLMPNTEGTSDVLKIQFAPRKAYPFTLEEESNPVSLMTATGCFACHSLGDQQNVKIAPNLERNKLVPRLMTRLNSEAYSRALMKLDESDQEPLASFRDARFAVDQAQDLEKIRLWLYYRILEPRFDDLSAQMPQLGLTNRQAELIAGFLSGTSEETTTTSNESSEEETLSRRIKAELGNAVNALKRLIPKPTRGNATKYGIALFGVGLLTGGSATIVIYVLMGFWRRKHIGNTP